MRPLRRTVFGLATVLGLKPLGFFIPYRHAASARPGSYPALDALFEAASPSFAAVLDAIEAHGDDFKRILAGEGPARFDQDWFPRLDAAAAYAIVRRERARRIVEIGSGHSTRFMARAVRDGGLATAITAIDPAPRADLSGLGVRHERRLLATADPALADGFGAGDVLFVDSSHIAMPGTDVDLLVGDVLPRLGPGALLHWHDILLPDPYPPDWTWRGYNESVPVAALLGSGGYDLVFASHWVATRMADRMGAGLIGRLPLPPGARETSLWLRRR